MLDAGLDAERVPGCQKLVVVRQHLSRMLPIFALDEDCT